LSIRSRIGGIIRQNGKNKDTETSRRFWLAVLIIAPAFILIVVMLGIQSATVGSIIQRTADTTNASALNELFDRTERSNQTLFNILLPVFSAWVGVVIAFYFGSEQTKRVQDTLEKVLTTEEKLSGTKVQDLLNKYPSTKNIHKVTLEDTIKDVINKFGDFSDVLVVKDDKPLGVLYQKDLYGKTELKDKDIKTLYEKKLKDVITQIEEEYITKQKWDIDKIMNNFAEVKSKDSLLTARKLMYERSKQIGDVRCVVVDESGKVVGIFGFDSIAAFME